MKLTLVCLAAAAVLMTDGNVALADSINSVSCSTPGTGLVSGSGSCSAADYGYANASAVSSVTLPTAAGQALQIDSDLNGTALLGGVRGITEFSSAESLTNVALNLNTTGPVRSGYLELGFVQSSWTMPGFGSISELLTIGQYSVSPDGRSLSVFIPIQLGTAFSLDFVDSLTVNGDAGTGAAAGAIGADISLVAFEADQTTAVALFDPPSSVAAVPEPGSPGMMAVGVLAVAGFVRAALKLSE